MNITGILNHGEIAKIFRAGCIIRSAAQFPGKSPMLRRNAGIANSRC